MKGLCRFLIFPFGNLLSASTSTLFISTRIVSQCFYPSKSFDTSNGLLLCFPLHIARFFIKRTISDLPKDTCSFPHLFKPTQGSLKRFFFFYLNFNHLNHLQSVACGNNSDYCTSKKPAILPV